jgi:hypothetical protein
MELGTIRSRFIQAQLQRVLSTDEDPFAEEALEELRRYFQWFAHTIPEPDRRFISRRLVVLEEQCRTNRRGHRIAY